VFKPAKDLIERLAAAKDETVANENQTFSDSASDSD